MSPQASSARIMEDADHVSAARAAERVSIFLAPIADGNILTTIMFHENPNGVRAWPNVWVAHATML